MHNYQCSEGPHYFEAFRSYEECDTAPCPEHQTDAKLVFLPKHQHRTAFDASEMTVVWRDPQGKINYPGRNDIPIPERLRMRGFERVELRSLREVERFESAHGVRNERAWFDKGSGRSFDNDGRDPKMERR